MSLATVPTQPIQLQALLSAQQKSMIMKAARWHAAKDIRVEEIDEPQVTPGEDQGRLDRYLRQRPA